MKEPIPVLDWSWRGALIVCGVLLWYQNWNFSWSMIAFAVANGATRWVSWKVLLALGAALVVLAALLAGLGHVNLAGALVWSSAGVGAGSGIERARLRREGAKHEA